MPSSEAPYQAIHRTAHASVPSRLRTSLRSRLPTRPTLLGLLACLLALLAIVRSSYIQPFFEHGHMRLPWKNNSSPNQLNLSTPPTLSPHPYQSGTASVVPSQVTGRRSVGYFVNWGIYDRQYLPQQLPADNLTHILYAFANVRPETGEVHLTDSWADEQIHWEGDSWDDQGNNLYGCLKQLYLLKKRYRHLRVMLSIGGWSFSANFTNLTNATHRQTFARTAVQLIEDYGLDGLDIDWEYPKNATQASAYTDLLRLTREELDRHQVRRDGTRVTFDLSIAAPCGPEQMKQLEVRAMDQYLTFWNLMAYDFSGSWSPEVSHQSQLYGPSNEASAHGSVSWYLSQGIRSDKIVLGMPLYGRSFANTTGLGANFSGVAPGTWEAGMYDYRALPRPGAIVGEDISRGASWTYDPSLREFVSYDTPNVAAIKARYVRDQNLGGLMWWEMDADLRPEDQLAAHALVPLATREMGGIGKEEWNCLDYGSSKWDNLKLGRI